MVSLPQDWDHALDKQVASFCKRLPDERRLLILDSDCLSKRLLTEVLHVSITVVKFLHLSDIPPDELFIVSHSFLVSHNLNLVLLHPDLLWIEVRLK